MLNAKILMIGFLSIISANLAYAATGVYLEPVREHPYSANLHKVSDARDVVRSTSSGTIVRSTSGACVRTRWSNGYDVCDTQAAAPPPPVIQKKIVNFSREERTVYFGFNQASLLPQMKERLDTLATAMKSESNVRGAQIVGYADRLGNRDYNEKLSKKRAENVRQYMISRGIINTRVAETKWIGEDEPVTTCSDDLPRPQLIDCLQNDRRVEVEIEYMTEVQASR